MTQPTQSISASRMDQRVLELAKQMNTLLQGRDTAVVFLATETLLRQIIVSALVNTDGPGLEHNRQQILGMINDLRLFAEIFDPQRFKEQLLMLRDDAPVTGKSVH